MKVSHDAFNKRVEQLLTPEQGKSPKSLLKDMLGRYNNKGMVNKERFTQNDNGELPAEIE